MVPEIVFRDVLNMAQTIGIIGTLALTFFFYKRHIQHLATDTETKILRDLDDKVHRHYHPSRSIVVNQLGTCPYPDCHADLI
jgi:hypothetical protein